MPLPRVRHDETILPARSSEHQDDSHNDWTYITGSAQEGQTYSADPSPSSRLLLSMLGAVAEFERSIIRERQADGIARAKARGVYKGRTPVPTEKIEQAKQLIARGMPKARAARELGISRSTLYKHLDEKSPARR